MCETEIKIVYVKKHGYKKGKETTHVEIGEEEHTSSYIWKIAYNVCYQKNGHKTRVQKDKVTIKKEKKSTYNPHYISKKYKHSPCKKNVLC